MLRKKSTWYREGWDLSTKAQSWTEETTKQVNFLIEALDLKGGEQILDLALDIWQRIPVFRFSCLPDESAVTCLEQAIFIS